METKAAVEIDIRGWPRNTGLAKGLQHATNWIAPAGGRDMGPFWNLPNILSLSRPLLGLPAIYLLLHYNLILPALFVFLGFAFTDLIDGWYARKKKIVTLWGKVLDPAADKVFLITTIFLVDIPSTLSKPFVALITLEILLAILGLTGLVMKIQGNKSRVEVSANLWGKMKATMENIFIYLLFIRRLGIGLNIDFLVLFLWSAITLAMLSIVGHIIGHIIGGYRKA